MESYARNLQENGRSDKYIKTELSAIRFFHNHIPATRHNLSDSRAFNHSIGLSSTPDGRADRAWTEKEIEGLKNIANDLGRTEISDVIEGMRSTGARIDEIVTLRDSDLRNSLNTGILHLENTKGGIPRDVPLTERARELTNQLQFTDRGQYVFTPKEYVESQNTQFQAINKNIYIITEKKYKKERYQLTSNWRTRALTSHGQAFIAGSSILN